MSKLFSHTIDIRKQMIRWSISHSKDRFRASLTWLICTDPDVLRYPAAWQCNGIKPLIDIGKWLEGIGRTAITPSNVPSRNRDRFNRWTSQEFLGASLQYPVILTLPRNWRFKSTRYFLSFFRIVNFSIPLSQVVRCKSVLRSRYSGFNRLYIPSLFVSKENTFVNKE